MADDLKGVRGDVRMVQQAIRHRWLTDDMKPLAMAAIERGLLSGDDRAEQAAVRSLILMEAQNQKDEHAKVDEFNQRLIAIAKRCGVRVDLLGIGEDAAGCASFGDDGVNPETEERTR